MNKQFHLVRQSCQTKDYSPDEGHNFLLVARTSEITQLTKSSTEMMVARLFYFDASTLGHLHRQIANASSMEARLLNYCHSRLSNLLLYWAWAGCYSNKNLVELSVELLVELSVELLVEL